MAPIISACTQVALTGQTDAGAWTNVYHWIGLGGGPPDAEAGSRLLAGHWSTTIQTVLCHDQSVVSASYVDLRTLDGAAGDCTPETFPVDGGDSGFMAAPNLAALIIWSATGSRSQRNGRTYLTGINEDQVDAGGNMTSTYGLDLEEQIALFQSALEDDGIQLVVNSKVPGGGYEPRTITGFNVPLRCATQRRRLRR